MIRVIVVALFFLISCDAKKPKIDKSAFEDLDLYKCVLENLERVGTVSSDATNNKITNKFDHLSCTDSYESYKGLEQLDDLVVVILSPYKATDLSPLSGLSNLKSLTLMGGNIEDVTPLAQLTELKHLNINWNNIKDISPLSALTNLESLYLDKNQISDISALSNLHKLKILHLTDNNISEVKALRGLLALEELYLNRNEVVGANPIKDATPLLQLSNLKKLGLIGDTINCDHRKLLRETFSNIVDIPGNGCPSKFPCTAMKDMQERHGDELKYDFEACTVTFPTEAESLKRN